MVCIQTGVKAVGEPEKTVEKPGEVPEDISAFYSKIDAEVNKSDF